MRESTIPTTFDSHISISIISVLLLIVVMAALPVASAAITTYDFSSGKGSDKWAYHKQCDSKPPSTNSDPNAEFSSGEYNKITSNDGTMKTHQADSTYYAAHRFEFAISENTNSITQIYAFWNGKGEKMALTDIDGATLYIWNYGSDSYEQFDMNSDENEVDLEGTITSNIGNYMDASGYLIILVEQNSKTALNVKSKICTDYVKVDVTTSTTVTSCNVNGTEKDQFAHGESVYVKAKGLAASTSYGIWIQNYTVNEGATLRTDMDESGAREIVTTAANGSFGYGVGDCPNPVTIWEIPLDAEVTNHEHDIVVDHQSEGNVGTYNAADDGLDSASVAGIIAPTPDVSALILFASGLMLAAVCFVYGKRREGDKK